MIESEFENGILNFDQVIRLQGTILCKSDQK